MKDNEQTEAQATETTPASSESDRKRLNRLLLRRIRAMVLENRNLRYSLSSRFEQLEKRIAHLHKSILENALSTRRTQSDVFLQELTRTLLLSGSGERFEPAVSSAIRDYRETLEEIQRFSEDKTLTDLQRQNIIAGFRRVLTQAQTALQRLGVSIDSVTVGSRLELGTHHVVNEDPTDDSEKVGTISRCLLPGFRWTNGQGQERRKPPEVALFIANSKPLPTADDNAPQTDSSC